MLTKKHFERAARMIRAHKQLGTSEETRHAMAEVIAILAREDNPRYDHERFLKACELK